MFREEFHSWLRPSCLMKIHISPGVEGQSPRTGEKRKSKITWPDSRRWELGHGAQLCMIDIIFWGFNWPSKQIPLVTKTESGNMDYPPTFTILQVSQIWRCRWLCGSSGFQGFHLMPSPLTTLLSPSPPPQFPLPPLWCLLGSLLNVWYACRVH